MRLDPRTWGIAAGAVLLFVVVVVLFWPRGADEIWAEATKPYQSECNREDCIEVVAPKPGHGGGQTLQMVYDPDVDDAIAQWGDCLDEVLVCRRETGKTLSCVQEAACPAACINQFETAAANLADERERAQLFLVEFVEDGGFCVPNASDGYAE
ncbi:hypothetical protein P1J78_23785 [Psychromarinibacter sp. C21-152]|uniref:Uncharacterized protein n=1 Tax=Psychromarinibacter sediminicola TaxID=3033385 RepID=A0AAE3NX75_9RHOB|nr:hypothetical protein [Psychromarinibacter sediminicola]MDF0603746.1 hypothetical protein [Psychromarinibacter sediminicola]